MIMMTTYLSESKHIVSKKQLIQQLSRNTNFSDVIKMWPKHHERDSDIFQYVQSTLGAPDNIFDNLAKHNPTYTMTACLRISGMDKYVETALSYNTVSFCDIVLTNIGSETSFRFWGRPEAARFLMGNDNGEI